MKPSEFRGRIEQGIDWKYREILTNRAWEEDRDTLMAANGVVPDLDEKAHEAAPKVGPETVQTRHDEVQVKTRALIEQLRTAAGIAEPDDSDAQFLLSSPKITVEQGEDPRIGKYKVVAQIREFNGMSSQDPYSTSIHYEMTQFDDDWEAIEDRFADRLHESLASEKVWDVWEGDARPKTVSEALAAVDSFEMGVNMVAAAALNPTLNPELSKQLVS